MISNHKTVPLIGVSTGCRAINSIHIISSSSPVDPFPAQPTHHHTPAHSQLTQTPNPLLLTQPHHTHTPPTGHQLHLQIYTSLVLAKSKLDWSYLCRKNTAQGVMKGSYKLLHYESCPLLVFWNIPPIAVMVESSKRSEQLLGPWIFSAKESLTALLLVKITFWNVGAAEYEVKFTVFKLTFLKEKKLINVFVTIWIFLVCR